MNQKIVRMQRKTKRLIMLLGAKTIVFFSIWGVTLSILLAEGLVDLTRFWSTVMSGSLVFFIGYVLTIVGFRTDNIDEILRRVEPDEEDDEKKETKIQ